MAHPALDGFWMVPHHGHILAKQLSRILTYIEDGARETYRRGVGVIMTIMMMTTMIVAPGCALSL